MNELSEQLATATGMSADDVSRLLTELANTAYAHAADGFVLPGFGKFQLVAGESRTGVNPFTRKTQVFHAPPNVEFTVDTDAEKGFRTGNAEKVLPTSADDAAEVLAPIRLVPDAQDAEAAGIEAERIAEAEFKVGGEPDWRQAPAVPVCCGQPMLFYGQLDSLGGDYIIGDVGLLYVFLCRLCCSSRSILQY